MRRHVVKALCSALILAPSVQAQEHAHEQFGSVHFATTCAPATVATFDRGVAQLHSFEFRASINSFTEVLAQDSTCAMAHWGIALSRWTNPMVPDRRSSAVLQQGKTASDAALRLRDRASERERSYINAVAELYHQTETRDQPARVLAYARVMGDVVDRFPADTEAKIFHAIALVGTASPSDKTFAKQLEAGRILEALWSAQPNHPGIAHYIIHAYDYPPLASKAREAARRYAAVAPSAAHALHMPSHTFTRVGLWDNSIEANRRSKAVALRDGSIGEALHASDYLVYAYLQLGREREAKAVIDSLPQLAARFDPNVVTGAAPGSAGVFALAAMPARWVIERQAWREAATLRPATSDFPYADAMTHFARALGSARIGDLANARTSIDSLAAFQRRLSGRGEAYWAEQVAIQQLAAQAWLALAERRETDALARMREAATREDATEKSAVTPGPLAPARELLGDMLMELQRPADAREEYRRALEREPNRRHTQAALRQATGS